jgi:enterobactin synthetase component D
MIELIPIEDTPSLVVEGIELARCRFAFGPAGLAGANSWCPAGDPELEVALPASLSRAVTKRQVEFVAGRVCAARAMRRLRGECHPVAIRPDRTPDWPEGLVGSISHTDGLALAGVAEARHWRSLGLDVEQEMSMELLAEVGSMVLDEAEWRHRPAGWRETAFATLAFSAKEALYKALYPLTGRMMEFRDARLLTVARREAMLELAPAMRSDRLPSARFAVRYGFEGPVCLTMLALAT